MRSKKIVFIILTCICLCIGCACSPSDNSQKPSIPKDNGDTDKTELPTVIIDAGHGGEDGGAVGTNGVFEKDLNLKIAKELDAMLRAAGINTRLTRTEDILLYDKNVDYHGRKKALDMAARLAITKEYENAVFISIHMNKFTQPKYSGLQVYYSENSAKSKELARLVQELTVKNLQPDNNRKIKPSAGNIYLLENILHPAILIECGFLSNADECEALCTPEYQKRLCVVIYSSIMNYFDTYANNPSPSS